jgi:hypothetical protein
MRRNVTQRVSQWTAHCQNRVILLRDYAWVAALFTPIRDRLIVEEMDAFSRWRMGLPRSATECSRTFANAYDWRDGTLGGTVNWPSTSLMC